MTHSVTRTNLFDSVNSLYKSQGPKILEEYPFRVKFDGELGVDLGGVSRDMFSGYYEEMYEKVLDGASLLYPVVQPHTDLSSLPEVGMVISHAYLVSGCLPTRMVFPSLAQCLLGPATKIPCSILVESFLDSLSPYDASVLRDALREIRCGSARFSDSIECSLISTLSRFGLRKCPNPENIKSCLSQTARFEFLLKPAAVISATFSGVPRCHKSFWEQLGMNGLLALYNILGVSPAKVLSMLTDVNFNNPNEERVYGYLQQYIGSMDGDELRRFVRFTTGSTVCMALKIQIIFNSMSGIARRPIAHTCTPSLELSSMYDTYLEFVHEFQAHLLEDSSWVMNAL